MNKFWLIQGGLFQGFCQIFAIGPDHKPNQVLLAWCEDYHTQQFFQENSYLDSAITTRVNLAKTVTRSSVRQECGLTCLGFAHFVECIENARGYSHAGPTLADRLIAHDTS